MQGPRGIPGPQPSTITQEKSIVAKSFIEDHYSKLLKKPAAVTRPKRQLCIDDFELFQVIGQGGFGEVRLCRKRDDPSGEILAMKKLVTATITERRQNRNIRSERDAMAEATLRREKSPWVVDLKHAFQDEAHLYFVMEWLPGGDLMWWLMEKGIFQLHEARQCAAEIVEAVHSIHEMNFVHRDIKPDNILVGRDGHLRLSDFGLCKKFPSASEKVLFDPSPAVSQEPGAGLEEEGSGEAGRRGAGGRQRKMFYSVVGSPGFYAPEVLASEGYTASCDWWSVGVLLYEMLVGYSPFDYPDLHQVTNAVLNWRTSFAYPGPEPDPDYPDDPVPEVPDLAKDLISRLICDASDRYTYEQIKAHPFFDGVDWGSLNEGPGPFDIELDHPLDARYFEQFETDHTGAPTQPAPRPLPTSDNAYLYYGFNFNSPNRDQPSPSE